MNEKLINSIKTSISNFNRIGQVNPPARANTCNSLAKLITIMTRIEIEYGCITNLHSALQLHRYTKSELNFFCRHHVHNHYLLFVIYRGVVGAVLQQQMNKLRSLGWCGYRMCSVLA